jgi:hypothetical protein
MQLLIILSSSGEKGKGSLGKPLHYKGSKFHRIIPRFMLQGLSPLFLLVTRS